MEYITVTGLSKQVSRIALGTGWMTPDKKDLAFSLFDAYVKAGGNFFDTARIYGNFAAEDVLSEWLMIHKDDREKFVVLTKGCHHEFGEHGEFPTHCRVSAHHIEKDLSISLQHLRLDYVDIYLLHRDDPKIPVSELMDVLENKRRAGKIRAYGVSNWTYERIEEANNYCYSKGYQGLSVSSPAFSLAEASKPIFPTTVCLTRPQLLQFAKQPKVTNIVWSSQAQGFFNRTPEQMAALPEAYKTKENMERKRRVAQLCALKGRDVYTPTTIALAYVLAQPVSLCAVIGPNSLKYLSESLSALSVKLTEKEVAYLALETDSLE